MVTHHITTKQHIERTSDNFDVIGNDLYGEIAKAWDDFRTSSKICDEITKPMESTPLDEADIDTIIHNAVVDAQVALDYAYEGIEQLEAFLKDVEKLTVE